MPNSDMLTTARGAGLLYAAIIGLGLTSELALRGGLLVPGDAAATAAAVAEEAGRLRLAVMADMGMALADVGLAVLLYRLFRESAPGLALGATAFRLVQAAVIGASLPLLLAAVAFAELPGAAAQAAEALMRHAAAYDLGLMFFGVNSLLTGLILLRLGGLGRLLGPGVIAAGGVYMIGTSLRVLAPDMAAAFAPAYGIAVLAETALCLWLLAGGAWRPVRGAAVA